MSERNIPSLDGLRALAVGVVLVGHELQMGELRPSPFSALRSGLAHLGVNIFFVISGFLITLLLLKEQDRNGGISLGKFYARRALRIFPAAYLLIATVVLLSALGLVQLNQGDVIHAATYTTNYHPDRAWSLGHLWSLAVEEQFYLLWPLAIVMLPRRLSLWLALGVILAEPLIRVAWWVLVPTGRAGIDEEFQLVCDGLATGCALALLSHRYGIEAVAARIHPLLYALAPFIAVGCAAFSDRPSFTLPLGVTLGNIAIALVMLWCVTRPRTYVGRALNSRIAIYLGSTSYSIYLWQQLFMDRTNTAVWLRFPLNLLFVLVVAVASYSLVEKPLWGLRSRFRP
jgi:peptidoglycan/LPS O-acetylase OafA/YrhL